jgi:hypothetical protein
MEQHRLCLKSTSSRLVNRRHTADRVIIRRSVECAASQLLRDGFLETEGEAQIKRWSVCGSALTHCNAVVTTEHDHISSSQYDRLRMHGRLKKTSPIHESAISSGSRNEACSTGRIHHKCGVQARDSVAAQMDRKRQLRIAAHVIVARFCQLKESRRRSVGILARANVAQHRGGQDNAVEMQALSAR